MQCDKMSDNMFIETTPVAIHFSSRVKLTLHDAFLPTAGLLQCEPIATVFVVTMQNETVHNSTTRSTSTSKGQGKREQSLFPTSTLRSIEDIHESNPEPNKNNNSNGDTERSNNCILSCKQVAQSSVRYFTSRPTYNETFQFDVQEASELTTFASAFAHMHLSLNPQNNNGNSLQESSVKSKNNNNNNYNSNYNAKESNRSSVKEISDGLVIIFEDVHKEHFYGAAYCPFSLHANSNTPECPTSVMLMARNAFYCGDALYKQDIERLKELELVTYGYVNISWEVNLIPRGGVVSPTSCTNTSNSNNDNNETNVISNVETCTPAFPVGLAIRAQWLYPSLQYEEHNMREKVKYIVAVEFGEDGTDRFVVAPHQPLCFTLRANPQSDILTFHCTMTRSLCTDNCKDIDAWTYHNSNKQTNAVIGRAVLEKDMNEQEEVVEPSISTRIHLLSLTQTSSYDRDVRYTCPLRTESGISLGVLNVLIRLSHNSLQNVNDKTKMCPNNGHCTEINNPIHQLEYTHSVNINIDEEEGIGAMPLAPHSSYQEVYWENEKHKRTAVERHYKYKCVHEACPTVEHVRHVFDVLLKKVALDSNVAHVAGLFCKCNEEELTLHELKEFMVGLAFHAKNVSAFQAARFCFFALRHDVENAVAINEVEYIFQHSLLSRTLDLPESEITRYVRDIFGPTATQVTYKEFTQHILFNYSLWSGLGVPLCVDQRTLITTTPTSLLKTLQCWKNITDHVGGEENNTNKPMVILQLTDEIEKAQNKSVVEPSSINNNNKNNTSINKILELPSVLPSVPTLTSNLPCESLDKTSITNTTNSMKEQQLLQEQESSTFSKTKNEMANLSDPQIWRSFVVRLVSNKKGYSVTAHVNDTIYDVMKMIEETIHLPANRQEWRMDNNSNSSSNNTYLDPKVKIGASILGLPPAIKHKRNVSATIFTGPTSSSSFLNSSSRSFRLKQQSQQNTAQQTTNELHCTSEMSSATRSSFNTVWIRETEEMIELTFVCKDRHKRWQERFAVNEKILRVRAAVQRVTLIPLSRCVLRLRRKVQIDNEEQQQQTMYNTNNNELPPPQPCETISIMLADRHRIAHYNFEPNDVIEVYQG